MTETKGIKHHWLLGYGLSLGLALVGISQAQAQTAVRSGDSSAPGELAKYNVVFNTPSQDETGSIPLGNGNLGVNLWVEEDGDLMFYLARKDAWSEILTMLKLGRVRLHLNPNPFAKGLPYRQELKLREGRCEIEAGPEGGMTRITIFVDSDAQDVRIRVQSQRETSADVALLNWRTDRRDAHTRIGNACYPLRGAPSEVETWVSADHWDHSDAAALVSYHRNESSPVDIHIKWQGMEDYRDIIKKIDFLENNTFGLKLTGRGGKFAKIAEHRLRSSEASRDFEIVATTHCAQTPDAATFLTRLNELATSAPAFDVALQRTEKYWSDYWNRSWLFVSGDTVTIPLNSYHLTLGKIDGGGGDFSGQINRASLMDRAMDDGRIRELSGTPPEKSPICEHVLASTAAAQGAITPGKSVDHSADNAFSDGVTAEAWITRTGDGRVWDKAPPGSAAGFVLDINGGKLRLIAGPGIYLESKDALPLNLPVHVAAVVQPGALSAKLFVNGVVVASVDGGEEGTPSRITQAYVLSKYTLACQMGSTFLASFNGGIFRMDPRFAAYALDYRDLPSNPDDQFYGNSYWWQNNRLLYQPQAAQGAMDFHRLLLTHMNQLAPVMKARAKKYYNADGIYFEECFTPFGLPTMGDFGWGAKEYSEPYSRWTWQHGLEASVLMLEDYAYTLDEAFLRTVAIPYASDVLRFFNTRFKKDKSGTIHAFPTHALETYWTDVENDTPSVAGMHYIADRLLALPERLTSSGQRTGWKAFKATIPPVPMCEYKGKRMPDNAAVYQEKDINRGAAKRANFEAPDLYSVFPFRIYGLEKTSPDLQEAINAFEVMPVPGHTCWYQTGIFAARLGLTEKAKEDVVERSGLQNRLRRTDQESRPLFRFPGFFQSPHDSPPDYDGPANMMTTLQEMLLQNGEQNEILLLQAWPREWNAKFKLHAHANTTVEGELSNGKLMNLKIEPKSREKDVRIPKWAQ